MGRSLRPLLEGRTGEPAPVFEARPPGSPNADGTVAVIQGRYKLYRHTRPKARWLFAADYMELYDVERDRDELRNLADELPDVARTLASLIDVAPPGTKPCFIE
jgi:arylsulfatase A-like enzyme